MFYLMEKNNENKMRLKEVKGYELGNDIFYYRDRGGNMIVTDSLSGRKLFSVRCKKESLIKKLNEMMDDIEKVRKTEYYKKYVDQFNKLLEEKN